MRRYLFFISLVFINSSGCIKRPKNPLLTECQKENVRLQIELSQKNERLKKFKQVDDNGQLRQGILKGQ